MRRLLVLALAVTFLCRAVVMLDAQPAHDVEKSTSLDVYRDSAARLIGEAVSSTFAWDRLSVLTDTIGNRLSGTRVTRSRHSLGGRGNEAGWPGECAHRTGDGPEVGTRQGERRDCRAGAAAIGHARARRQHRHHGRRDRRPRCWSCRSFDELEAKGAAARGKIVLFNVPFTTYGETVRFRSERRLARRTTRSGRDADPRGRPGRSSHAAHRRAAVRERCAEDSRRLDRHQKTPTGCSGMTDRGGKVVLRFKMDAHFEADAESANVVGEIRGRERPDEVVVVSGHLDSWDVGAGATDDGGGCVVDVGGAAHHEEAEPASAAHRAGGAVDQRGKRRARRPRLSRSASRRAGEARDDARVRRRSFRPLGFGFTGNEPRARR